MDALPLHPKVVHLPLALAALMPLVTGGLLLAWWRGFLPRRAWIIAVLLQAICAGSGFFAMRTGEAEEERVERVVSHDAIEAHEEAAELFVYAAAGVLVVAVLAAALKPQALALGLAALTFAGSLGVLALAVRAGEAGGALVYRHGAASAYVETRTAPAPEEDRARGRERDRGRKHEPDDD